MTPKILIADDEPDILMMLEHRLSNQGCDVMTAVNGKEAWEKINQHRPDLVFLDFRMPLLNGLEICKRIKEDENLKKIFVVIVTASQTLFTHQSFLSVHADGVLVKPYEPEELAQVIKKFLK